ncbi:MAG: Gfo/Idh/MocA family oxidoreductase [Clostridia bacterium]|nr:Gfo/Idh/MocA family oxidoreductase [Clostridia bacterium]
MIKIAVVGLGIISEEHLDAIYESNDFQLVAVCDVIKDKAKEAAEKYKTNYFFDYHEIPKMTDAEAVIINLPHFLHCESTVFFLENGLHVLVEKPMANNTKEAALMNEAAEKSGKKLAIGHIQRFFKANTKLKEIIDSSELGKLCMSTELRTVDYFNDRRPKWFLQKEKSGGGIVINYGAHALDKLFYLIGITDVEIHSLIGNVNNDYDVEGHAQFFVKFKDGPSSAITFSGYSSVGYECIYYFEKGCAKVTGSSELFINKDGTWEYIDVKEDNKAMHRQLAEFKKYINGEPSLIVDGEYGYKIIAAIEKVYEEH